MKKNRAHMIMEKAGNAFSINTTTNSKIVCPCGLEVFILNCLVWPENDDIVEIAKQEKHETIRIGYCECGNMFLRSKRYTI